MKIETRKLDDLIPYENNPRKNDHAVPKVAAAIKEFGFRVPVFIENSSKAGDLVLDPFGGSGSTLIACEKTGRMCCTMELDEKFCDVIINRWQEFTGNEATLDGDGRSFAEIMETRI